MRGWSRFVRKALALCLAAGALTGLLSASTTAAGATPPKTSATWAEIPQTPPNYIFPFMSLAFFGVSNVNQFQYLLFRPLYWFGNGTTPGLNQSLSLAVLPRYADDRRSVEIDLKDYRWSDGEQVTSQDVAFWMNMLHAEKANWAGYIPGGDSLPDNVENITIDSPTRLTFELTKAYNTDWFTYNELSQITPLPLAWDKTTLDGAPGSGGCAAGAFGTVDTQCAAVYTFLSSQAGYDPKDPGAPNGALSTYATNPLWQVVDGPFRLTGFDATGNVTMVPNPSYSGPVKASIKTFRELPFVSDGSEFAALAAGKVDVGYLPAEDVTASTANPRRAGPNNPRLKSFTLDPLYTWWINYFPYNYNSDASGGVVGKIFQQKYFRQVMQYLVDQPGLISRLYHGYGVGTYGPVPAVPPSSFTSGAPVTNPYRYDPAKAVRLLQSHGWRVVRNGISSCRRPGTAANECGAGIPSGAEAVFKIQYASGTTIVQNTMRAEKASWARAGIDVSLSSTPITTVIGNAVSCPQGCAWQMANWGTGWVFAPRYYPSGELLFQTGAQSNTGGYSSATADNLIISSYLTETSLARYQNFIAQDLPVVFQPRYATTLTEIKHGLQGVTPQNVFWQINPEAWRWSS